MPLPTDERTRRRRLARNLACRDGPGMRAAQRVRHDSYGQDAR